ncbi:MAG: hypothetical protein AAF656_01615 [Planctomycetota bacterium]
MKIGEGKFQYEWHDHFVKLPMSPLAIVGGRTHGVGVLSDGDVVVFAQTENAVQRYDKTGKLKKKWGGQKWTGAHGITVVEEDGEDLLYLVDEESGAFVKSQPNGKVIEKFKSPKSPGKFRPTWGCPGPDGKIWLADGYGSELVHCWDGKDWKITLDGTEGAGRFKCPHGIAFSPAGELYVADRGNQRISIYDADGKFLRNHDKLCHTPNMFVFHDKHIYVPELHTGIKVFDMKMKLVAEIGANPGVTETENWPNLGKTKHVQPGKFNSPHCVAVAENGDVYVAEWIIGGRVTWLEKV